MKHVERWDDIRYVAVLERGAIDHDLWSVYVSLYQLLPADDGRTLTLWKDNGFDVDVPVETVDEADRDVLICYQSGGCYEMILGRDRGLGGEGMHFCDLAEFARLAEAVRRAAWLAAPHLQTETPEAR